MASIRLSSLVSDIAGTIGGTVFQRGPNGLFARTWSKPTNPRTPGQIKQRLNLATYANKWRSLTDEDRQAWNDAAPMSPYRNRVGETKTYTGFQLYMQTNLRLESAAC